MATLVTRAGGLLRFDGAGGRVPITNSGWWSDTRVSLTDDETGFRTVSYAEVYETQPVVAAVVNKLVRTLSTLPLKTYVRSGADREQVNDHPLERLFRRPVPGRGAVDFKQWVFMPLLVHGNALVAKYRGNGADEPPTELLPLDWRFLSAYGKPGGPIEYWVTTQTGEDRWIPASETIHFKWDAPTGQLGVSPLKQLGTTIRLEDAAQRYQAASFRNGARPSGAVVLPKEARLDAEERNEIRANLKQMHEGVDNSFRVALLTGGADWKPMSFSAAEAELNNTRVANREEVCMVFDVKPTVIGDLTHGTYSNVTELNRDFYKTTARPPLTLVEETLQSQLIDSEPGWEERFFVEFDMAEQLKGDPLQEAQAISMLIQTGAMTPNEGRRRMNRPPDASPLADRLWLATNNLQPLPEDGVLALPQPEAPQPPATVIVDNARPTRKVLRRDESGNLIGVDDVDD